jgi:DNA-binding transcriptional LysR family regulator
LTLQQLLYFRAAAELGSFNAAARRLHCTQPAVSDQVRRLESDLGVSLFARAGRGLTLTSAGRVFLSHAERVTEAADDALTSVGRRHAAHERAVMIGTFRNAPYYDIAELAGRAQEAGIALEPRVEVEHAETALQLVARGLGSTIAARAVFARSAPSGVSAAGFAEPFYDFFALITRRGVRVSPGTLALIELVDDWARTVAAGL